MPRVTSATAEGLSLLTPYWSSIVGARAAGYNRAETWGIIQEAFQAGGPTFQGATIFDMNTMWSRAGEVLNAEAAFGASPAENAITADMWAWAPWTTPSTFAQQVPNYMTYYAYQAADAEGNLLVDVNGDPLQVWGAGKWEGPLPDTVGEMTAFAQESAQTSLDIGSPGTIAQLGGISGINIVGITAVQVLRF